MKKFFLHSKHFKKLLLKLKQKLMIQENNPKESFQKRSKLKIVKIHQKI